MILLPAKSSSVKRSCFPFRGSTASSWVSTTPCGPNSAPGKQFHLISLNVDTFFEGKIICDVINTRLRMPARRSYFGFCETHTQVFFSSFRLSSSGLNFASSAAALSHRAGRDSNALCGECTTSELSGLQLYLAQARLHPEAF